MNPERLPYPWAAAFVCSLWCCPVFELHSYIGIIWKLCYDAWQDFPHCGEEGYWPVVRWSCSLMRVFHDQYSPFFLLLTNMDKSLPQGHKQLVNTWYRRSLLLPSLAKRCGSWKVFESYYFFYFFESLSDIGGCEVTDSYSTRLLRLVLKCCSHFALVFWIFFFSQIYFQSIFIFNYILSIYNFCCWWLWCCTEVERTPRVIEKFF